MFCLGVLIHLSNRWGSILMTWYNAANVSARVVLGSNLNSIVDLPALRPYGFTVVTWGFPCAYATSAVATCVRAISNITVSSISSVVMFRTRRSLTSLVVLSLWIHSQNCLDTRFSSVLLTNFENLMRYCDGRKQLCVKTYLQDTLSRRYTKTPYQDGTPRHPVKTVHQDTLSRRYVKTPSTLSRHFHPNIMYRT